MSISDVKRYSSSKYLYACKKTNNGFINKRRSLLIPTMADKLLLGQMCCIIRNELVGLYWLLTRQGANGTV